MGGICWHNLGGGHSLRQHDGDVEDSSINESVENGVVISLFKNCNPSEARTLGDQQLASLEDYVRTLLMLQQLYNYI